MVDPIDVKVVQAGRRDAATLKAKSRVVVRLAGNTDKDIEIVVRLIFKAIGESRYKDLPFAKDRLKEFVQLGVRESKLVGFILAERTMPSGENEAIGIICAMAGMLPFANVVSCGTLLFYVVPTARSPRVAALLTEAFKRWSENRKAYEATFHVTMGSNNDNRVSKLLELYGFEPSGGSHFKDL